MSEENFKKINYKYLAGFLDSDGNIYCDYRTSGNGTMYPIIKISIKQKHCSILFYIKTFLECGSIYYNRKSNICTFYLVGNDSIDFIKNIIPYLIVKKPQAEFALEVINQGRKKHDHDEIKKIRLETSKLRFVKSENAVFTKEWFAGFFDGDGYIGAYKANDAKKPKITMAITYDKKDEVLGEILIGNLGGYVRITNNLNPQWCKNINSKEINFLKDLSSHCIGKTNQVKDCIEWLQKYPTHKRNCVEASETSEFVKILKHLKTEDSNLFHALMMNVDNYQLWTRTTATYPQEFELEYLATGLAGECGEICNKYKKVIRGDYTLESISTQLADECGDVLYYLARILDVLGVKLSEIMDINHAKLDSRQERGTIGGSGDVR